MENSIAYHWIYTTKYSANFHSQVSYLSKPILSTDFLRTYRDIYICRYLPRLSQSNDVDRRCYIPILITKDKALSYQFCTFWLYYFGKDKTWQKFGMSFSRVTYTNNNCMFFKIQLGNMVKASTAHIKSEMSLCITL